MGEKVSVNKNAECQAGLGRRPQSAFLQVILGCFFASCVYIGIVLCG